MTVVLDEETPLAAARPPTARGRWMRRVEGHPVLTVVIVALLARVVCALVISKIFGGVLFNDDSTYSGMARAVVRGYASTSWDDYTRYLYNSTATFSVPLTGLYWILGPNQLAGQLLASCFGVAAAAAVSFVALRVVSRHLAIGAGLVVALLPSQVLFSSLTLKDPAVWAALAVLAVAVAATNDRAGRAVVGPAVAVAVLLVAIAHLRLHTFVIAIWAVAIASWAGSPEWRARRGVAAAMLALTLPWLLGAGPGGFEVVRAAGDLENIRLANAVGAATALVKRPPMAPSSQRLADVTRELSMTRERLRTAATSDVEALRKLLERQQRELARLEAAARAAARPDPSSEDTWVRANVTYLPKGLAIVVLGPFPWEINGNSRVLLAAFELVFWYPLLALAGYGVFELRRRGDVLLFPALVGAGSALMYGLAEGNFGTAYRHRGELVWAVALLAAVGVARWRRRHAVAG